MFVDASALVAILLDEPERASLSDRLEDSPVRLTSPVAFFEAAVALMRHSRVSRRIAERDVRDLLGKATIEIIPITDEIGRAALAAFDRYGKRSGHPAQLNMGDCFAYGAARILGVPLLYKGDDFAKTELG